uniref:Membrane protein n=1 Tax=Byssovorax cruenta TaxID=293647 RepID=A0A3S5GXY4_9BACT|nr:membrane protein [Byssovorax cruenta]
MGTLSTSAWVLHDLGMAAGFGGSLYGKLALHPAVKDVASQEERGKLLYDTWHNYNYIDAISLGAMAIPWFIGRTAISGRSIDRTTRGLVLAKDVLIGASIITGIANMVSNKLIGEERPGGAVPFGPTGEPTPMTPPRATALKRFLAVSGPLHTVFVGGVIGLTAALAMKSGKSSKWSFLSRFLP